MPRIIVVMKHLSKEEAAELVKKHGTQAAAARSLKVAPSTFREWLNGGRQGASRPKKKAPEPQTRTIVDFRKEHDQTWKIRDGLKRLFNGGVIMTDAEFRTAVCGNSNRWRSAADATEFKDNRYRVGGELLWANAETIKEMKRIRGEAL